MDDNTKIQVLVAELRRLSPGPTAHAVATRLVVAEGVLASVMAELVAGHGLDALEIGQTVGRQLREMMDNALTIHPLN